MSYKELMETKEKICRDYINHYNERGYVELSPLPLNNKKDITLDFTTCTICSAKDNIRNSEKGKDYIMIQPALRNTHMDVLGKLSEDDYFFSFFSMMGGFKFYNKNNSKSDQFSELIKNEFDFLKKYNEEVVLTIPIQYKDKLEINNGVIEYLFNNGCKIIYSTDDEKNLKWKYGMNDVVGYGTRWEISNGGDLVNWGNSINVFVKGEEYGIDFGGGVESLVYAHLKLKNSIYANSALTDNVRVFCEEDSINEKIMDCVISSMCIIANKPEIILRDKYTIDSYMNMLVSLMALRDVKVGTILDMVEEINNKKVQFLTSDDMIEKFSKNMHRAIRDFHILLESKSIEEVIKMTDLCYNEDNSDWTKNKRITNSHYRKYFTNLTEVEILALRREKRIEKEN